MDRFVSENGEQGRHAVGGWNTLHDQRPKLGAMEVG